MTKTIPLASITEEVVAQAVGSLELAESVAKVTDWTETPSGQGFMEFTAPSSAWAYQLAVSIGLLFRGRDMDVEVCTDDDRITIQVEPDFCK